MSERMTPERERGIRISTKAGCNECGDVCGAVTERVELLSEIDALRAELRATKAELDAIDGIFGNRIALDDLTNRYDKILRTIKIAGENDPLGIQAAREAELVKLRAELTTARATIAERDAMLKRVGVTPIKKPHIVQIDPNHKMWQP